MSNIVSSAVFYFITLPSFACGLSLTSAFPLQALGCDTACPNTSSPERLPLDRDLVLSLLAVWGSEEGPPKSLKLTSAAHSTCRRLAPLLRECLKRMDTVVAAGPPAVAAPRKKPPSKQAKLSSKRKAAASQKPVSKKEKLRRERATVPSGDEEEQGGGSDGSGGDDDDHTAAPAGTGKRGAPTAAASGRKGKKSKTVSQGVQHSGSGQAARAALQPPPPPRDLSPAVLSRAPRFFFDSSLSSEAGDAAVAEWMAFPQGLVRSGATRFCTGLAVDGAGEDDSLPEFTHVQQGGCVHVGGDASEATFDLSVEFGHIRIPAASVETVLPGSWVVEDVLKTILPVIQRQSDCDRILIPPDALKVAIISLCGGDAVRNAAVDGKVHVASLEAISASGGFDNDIMLGLDSIDWLQSNAHQFISCIKEGRGGFLMLASLPGSHLGHDAPYVSQKNIQQLSRDCDVEGGDHWGLVDISVGGGDIVAPPGFVDSGIAFNSPLVRALFTFAALAVLRIAGKCVVRQAGGASLWQNTVTVTVADVVRNQSVPPQQSQSSWPLRDVQRSPSIARRACIWAGVLH